MTTIRTLGNAGVGAIWVFNNTLMRRQLWESIRLEGDHKQTP
jgi:hypothetical protein